MSDFLYRSKTCPEGESGKLLQAFHEMEPPAVHEYHGEWGSLAVLDNHYRGFQPLVTESHIAVVIGGPLLCFRENDFLDDAESTEGTGAILERYLVGELMWEDDLSGPFACLIIDRANGNITYVTDLLMFVPVYTCFEDGEAVIGTHVDVVARASGRYTIPDPVSVADFILNHVVTHPYTCYQKVRQAEAGTIHQFSIQGEFPAMSNKNYWNPEEKTCFDSLDEAAEMLRKGLLEDVEKITRGADRVAAFLSAGEDSRTILGCLPPGVNCDGFTYLYGAPRDRAIARQVAKIFGVKHTVSAQPYHYYLEILSQASALVGSGHQYSHAHVIGFFEEWGLRDYRAVLGGYLSDSLLKGLFSRKRKGRGLLSWLPEFPRSGETHTRRQKSDFFTPEVMGKIQQRKIEHMERVKAIRPETCHEWFGVWPATMQLTFPNFLATRRLFRSYEPFMGRVSVMVGAGAPLTWKLNRRLFNRAVRPLLKPTSRVFHADGHLPYFPFWVNMPFVFGDKLKKYGAKAYHAATFLITGKETPWQRRRASKTEPEWQAAFDSLEESYVPLEKIINNKEARKHLSSRQTRNLLQVLEWIHRIDG